MKTVAEITKELEARMLCGAPFSYSELCYSRIFRDAPKDLDAARLVDRTIQKLRRKKLIAFTRRKSTPIWKATQST